MVCHFQYHSNFQCMQFIKSTLIPLKKTHIHALLLHTFKHIFFFQCFTWTCMLEHVQAGKG